MAAANTTSYPSRSEQNPSSNLIADNSMLFGTSGRVRNIASMIDKTLNTVSTGAGAAATILATVFPCGTMDLQPGATGGFTLTLPSTASILARYPNTIPLDGGYNVEIDILNDAVGQTATLTAGDASTTIVGTATIATNTTRTYLVNINVGAGTMTWINKGTKSL